MAAIEEQILQARRGEHPRLVCQLPSGWVVMGEQQPVKGYCLLLADPVVKTVNDLSSENRQIFLRDMVWMGDAIQQVTQSLRINYEMLGNVVEELHAHAFPRFADEPENMKGLSVFFYDWPNGPHYSETEHGALRLAIREELLTIMKAHDEAIAASYG